MMNRWQKIRRDTKCSQSDALLASHALRLLEMYKSIAWDLSAEARGYLVDKMADTLLEIQDGKP